MPDDDRPESVPSPNSVSEEREIPGGNGKAAPEAGEPRRGPEAPARTNEPPPRESADGGAEAGEPSREDPRVAELSSLLIHLKADFDNYRKRVQKEMASASRTGELEAVKRFIPAVSNLERALAAAGSAEGPLVDGMKLIHSQLMNILSGLKIDRIPGVGTPFDPALHDAVAATSNPDVPPGTVVDEFEAGWQADGRALVPAKVRVSTAE